MNKENQRRTFISYSRSNKDFALELAKELRSSGFNIWFDVLDIPTGSRWDDEVERALEECEIFMVVLTPASSASDNVKDEIGYAIDNNKRILPILLQNATVPLRLRRFQYVDFTSKNYEEGVASAKKLLTNLINETTVPREKIPGVSQYKENRAKEEDLAKQKATPAVEMPVATKVQPVPVAITQKKRTSNFLIIGILVVVVLVIAGIGFRFLSNGGSNSVLPSDNPDTESQDVEISASETSVATQTLVQTPTEDVTPTASAPQPEITDSKGAVMVLVPAGDFVMGTTEGLANERPVHTVYLDAYYIDKFEVTNALYGACVNAGICNLPIKSDSFTRSSYYGNIQYNAYPVVYVDWNMANAYCKWRDALLPTEAQWEKAARGSDARIYPWGKDVDCQKANYQNGKNGCVGGTSKVGSYEAGKSPYGVYDLAGNVFEWVNDWYSEAYYQASLPSNPLGPDSGQAKVVRGGSWTRDEYNIRTTMRLRFAVDYNNFDIGFRCAGPVP